MSSDLLTKLLAEIDNTEQLAILLDTHDIVKNGFGSAISPSISASDIEIYNLNNVSMPGFEGHSEFIEELFDGSGVCASSKGTLINALVHDLDGDSLISS